MPEVIDMEKPAQGTTWAMARSRFGRRVAKVGTAVAAATGTALAHASILPADFTDKMAQTGTDISTVGGAVIGLAVIALGIRWVKATFF